MGYILPNNDYGTIPIDALEEIIAFGRSDATYTTGLHCLKNTERHIAVYNTSFRERFMICSGEQGFTPSNHMTSLLEFNNCDFSEVTNLSLGLFQQRYCYCDCSSFNFSSNCTDVSYAFDGFCCLNNETLDLSNCDFSGATDTTGMFRNYNITASHNLIKNLKMGVTPAISFAINTMPNLTHDSLVSILNALPTVSTTQTLTLGSTLRNKLSDAEILIATGRRWTVN